MAQKQNASIIVVGTHGRKGPKADPTVMGSAVQYLSVETCRPVFIVKDPHVAKDRPDGFRYAACVDGSKKSLDALKMICDLKRPIDKITVITCEQANIDTAFVKGQVTHLLEERGEFENSQLVTLKSEYGRKTSDIIRDHLMNSDVYIDIVVIGNQGADFSTADHKKYLGSVANQIIRNTKINSIFIP
mmetsp:Transcript_5537/g.9448  ORF Transcript_5537/g.9448 Transcript_5537/m.9448 type:complete len:188 (-) Transcript_5537:96-659(-)